MSITSNDVSTFVSKVQDYLNNPVVIDEVSLVDHMGIQIEQAYFEISIEKRPYNSKQVLKIKSGSEKVTKIMRTLITMFKLMEDSDENK